MKTEAQGTERGKPKTRRLWLLFCVAVMALMVGVAHWLWQESPSTTASAPPAPLTRENQTEQGALDLALKTITLSQGEGGFELWRLKAEWANLRKQNDTIFVELPRLTYFMKDNGKPLFVSSETGDINQKTQILRFIDKVRVLQEDKLVTGDLLVYNGNDKTMTFPQGCAFVDAGVEGSARFLVWHIDRRLIEAEGDITVFLDGKNPATEGAAADPSEPAKGISDSPEKE